MWLKEYGSLCTRLLARQFDALSLLSLARAELCEAGLELAAVQFVACAEPLDAASPSAATTLGVMNGDMRFVMSAQGESLSLNLGRNTRFPTCDRIRASMRFKRRPTGCKSRGSYPVRLVCTLSRTRCPLFPSLRVIGEERGYNLNRDMNY